MLHRTPLRHSQTCSRMQTRMVDFDRNCPAPRERPSVPADLRQSWNQWIARPETSTSFRRRLRLIYPTLRPALRCEGASRSLYPPSAPSCFLNLLLFTRFLPGIFNIIRKRQRLSRRSNIHRGSWGYYRIEAIPLEAYNDGRLVSQNRDRLRQPNAYNKGSRWHLFSCFYCSYVASTSEYLLLVSS